MLGRDNAFSKRQSQRWMRVGAVLIGFAALVLLLTAFGARLYSGPLSSALLTVVLISLAIAIGLHARFCFWRGVSIGRPLARLTRPSANTNPCSTTRWTAF